MSRNALVKRPIVSTKPRIVTDEKGEVLTREALLQDVPPNNDNLRWTAGRKAKVIKAVKHNLITAAERDAWYKGSTPDEWNRDAEVYERHGINGLKVTKLQKIAGLR